MTIKFIEKETRDKSLKEQSNLQWNEARKSEITASKCKRVARMKESTSPVIALQEILHFIKFSTSDNAILVL